MESMGMQMLCLGFPPLLAACGKSEAAKVLRGPTTAPTTSAKRSNSVLSKVVARDLAALGAGVCSSEVYTVWDIFQFRNYDVYVGTHK